MKSNTTNFALTSLKNVFVLSTIITSDFSRKDSHWYFLVKKKNERDYFELFTNKRVHWLEASKIVFGILGEYQDYVDIHFEKLTHICDYSNRFKGMDLESYAALSEFITYTNIMSNHISSDSNLAFELGKE